MHIELNYSLIPDDVHEFQRSYPKLAGNYPAIGWQPRPYRFIAWGIFLAVAILLFLVAHKDHVDSPPATTPATAPSTPFDLALALLPYLFLGIVIWYFVSFRKRMSKWSAAQTFESCPALAEAFHITLTDESMTMCYPTLISVYAWAHFARFAETGNLFLLLTANQVSHILPKRAFPYPAAIDDFRAFRQAHIGNTPIGFPVQPPKSPPQSKIEN